MNAPGSGSHRIESLDGIRGLAILLVLMDHFQTYTVGWLPDVPQRIGRAISENGWVGVDVFFVLSGFLITSVLFSIQGRPDFWKYFYIRRAFRILPVVAWVCVPPAVALAVTHHISPARAILLLSPLSNWALIQSNTADFTHLWSLGVEEQFYLFWPFVVRFVDRKLVMRYALCIAVASLVAHLAAIRLGFSAMAIYKSTPTHLFGIALGSGIAAGMQDRAFSHRRTLAVLLAGCGSVLVGLCVAYGAYGEMWFHWDNPHTTIYAIVGVSMITGWSLIAATGRNLPAPLHWLLTRSVVRWFGRRSYAIYLVHVFVGHAVLFLSQSTLVRGVALIGGSLLLAELSWRWIEAPCLALGARLTRHRETLLEA